MALYTGVIQRGVGTLLPILDENLLDQSAYWVSVDPEAGTNKKVYGHLDPNSDIDFIFSVDDNYNNYSVIGIAEGWDITNKTYTGRTMLTGYSSNYKPVIVKHTTTDQGEGYILLVNHQRFIFMNTTLSFGNYIGYPKRFNTSLKDVLFIGHSESSSYTINPLGYLADGGHPSRPIFKSLVSNTGSTSIKMYGWGKVSGGYDLYVGCKTTAGTIMILETIVQEQDSPYFVHGQLDGVMATGNYSKSLGLSPGDTVYINGVAWKHYVGDGYGCFVRLD